MLGTSVMKELLKGVLGPTHFYANLKHFHA